MPIHTSSHHHRSTRRVPLDADADIRRATELARTVEAALAGDAVHPPTLVAAVAHDGDVEILLEPLAHHPAVELEGMVAPSSWWCLGVVAGGTARSLDDRPLAAPIPRPERPRVHLAHLVTRTGTVVRILRDRTTDQVLEHVSSADGPPDEEGGLIDDYLRRALLVPTPPPARDTTDLWAALWIHHVMNEAALHHLLEAPWATVACLHPVLDAPVAAGDATLRAWAVDHLVRAGELMAQTYPWRRVREACTQGIGPVSGRPAELAGWLDDGAFARLVLSSFGPLEDLVVDLHELVRPDVYQRVLESIDAWGLLDGPRLR